MMHHVGCRVVVSALWAFLLLTRIAHAQDGAFTSGSLQLHYRSSGAGTPIVLLSGGPGFEADYMLPVGELLPSQYRRIVFEQRGTGRSRPPKLTPEDMTLSVAVQDLDALREHLGQQRIALLGHSWGGMLAMAYAAAHPDRVDRLILLSSGGPTLEFAGWFDDNIRARLRPEDVEAEAYWTDAAKRGMSEEKAAIERTKAILPGYFFERAKALALAAEIKDGIYHPDVNSMLFADLGKNYDTRSGLRALDRPVLIVQGHQDPIGDKTAEDIHTLIKGSTLVYLSKCGHFPWLEQPEALRTALREFLSPAAKTKK
jgi:proline iminopeptidase